MKLPFMAIVAMTTRIIFMSMAMKITETGPTIAPAIMMIMIITMTIPIMTAMITATIAALMIVSIMALTIIEN